MASTKQDAALLVFESLNAKHVFFFFVVHELKQYCYHHCALSKSLLRFLQGD